MVTTPQGPLVPIFFHVDGDVNMGLQRRNDRTVQGIILRAQECEKEEGSGWLHYSMAGPQGSSFTPFHPGLGRVLSKEQVLAIIRSM